MKKYHVTLAIVVDAATQEHAEELARQLAPSYASVTVKPIGETSPGVVSPFVLGSGWDPDLGGANEVELSVKLTLREAALLYDLCSLQYEVLKNADLTEGGGVYEEELGVLQKFLNAVFEALTGARR